MNCSSLNLSVSYWSAHFAPAECEQKGTLTNQCLALFPVVVERSSVIFIAAHTGLQPFVVYILDQNRQGLVRR